MIRYIVTHRATVLLVTIAILVFGLITYASLPREASPDVKVPVVMVSTVYVGVSPEDVETLVTVPIENELAGLKDLKKMSSVSAEGMSLVTLEFEPDVVIEDVLQRARDRVNRARSKVPEDAEDTDIREVAFSDFPILIVTIGGPIDEEQLKKLGERLEDDLAKVDGVLEAKLSGGREREIRVQVDPYRLAHYSLSMNDVIGAIAAENVNIPGGNVTAGSANILLRVPGELDRAVDIEGVAVKRVGDRPVFVRDVARVVDGFKDRVSYARMNRQPAVSVSVSKRAGANIVDVADGAKAIASEHQARWPEGVTYRVLGDQSRFVRDMVSELENNIITALILVVGVLLFFMGVRNSLLTGLSIPLSMLLGAIVIWATGTTLNMVVLFSLILALGMLVDNAIVIIENIYRHMEEGKGVVDASIDGTAEVAIAVMASTLTTVGAFVPLLFWSGIMGEFMGYLPLTVIIVLVSSLVVAVGILPMLTGMLMKKSRRKTPPPTASAVPSSLVLRAYTWVLTASIRRRYIAAVLVTGLLFGSFVAYADLNHGTEFFPDTEPDQATIAVRAPDGTELETTDAIVRRVEQILTDEPNVDVFVAETGVAGGGDPMLGSQAATNQARLTIDFHPHSTKARPGDTVRTEDTRTTITRLRKQLSEIPGVEISVEQQAMGPPVGAPIAVEISGDDFHRLGELAARVRRELALIEGATDLRDDYRVGRPEMRLRIDRGAAKRVGASTQEVAGAVRTAVAGTKASALREGEDEHDITVELEPSKKNDLEAVLSMRIPGRIDTSPDTFAVPLSTVASYELAGGSGAIRRIDQDRVVTISGDVLAEHNQNAVREAVVARIGEIETAPGYRLRLGGADDEQRDAQEFLSTAFLVAIALIALVLVTQFNSFAIPSIILGSVVLSLVGVLWGLIITGTPFGVIMTGLGVISLAGVVVNNAIVLLDYVEQLRAGGMEMQAALVQAGIVRFRPVMLTAVTTILGLVPMAVGVSVDFATMKLLVGGSSGEWWGPMAVAVIFGLAFATVLTLVMVPTFYSIVEDIRLLPSRIFGRGRPVMVPPSQPGAE